MERYRRSRGESVRNQALQEFGFKFNRNRYGQLIDFTDPNGDTFTLQDGEEIVFAQNADGTDKKVFVRLEDGREVPFEEWREDKLPN